MLKSGTNTEKLKAADLVIKTLNINSAQAITDCGETSPKELAKQNNLTTPYDGIMRDFIEGLKFHGDNIMAEKANLDSPILEESQE